MDVRRVGPKGQVVIPEDVRDALGIRPGAAISEPLFGRFAEGSSLTDALLEARAEDRRAEDAAR